MAATRIVRRPLPRLPPCGKGLGGTPTWIRVEVGGAHSPLLPPSPRAMVYHRAAGGGGRLVVHLIAAAAAHALTPVRAGIDLLRRWEGVLNTAMALGATHVDVDAACVGGEGARRALTDLLTHGVYAGRLHHVRVGGVSHRLGDPGAGGGAPRTEPG